jgi:membrane protease YdiL (CAAX protease family)
MQSVEQERLLGGGPPRKPPRWSASSGLAGLAIGVISANLLVGLVWVLYLGAGVHHPDKSASFDFSALAAQSFALVVVALAVTQGASAREFGFRPFKSSAGGWIALALAVNYSLWLVYALLAHPPQDKLPEELGADQGTALAIVTGIFVIGVAPVVEEFFFRGFLYQALRSRIGVWGGAAVSGLLFGAIHFKPEFLVPLAILGMVLALLFEKTGSLWPCILVHALNNALAFGVNL